MAQVRQGGQTWHRSHRGGVGGGGVRHGTGETGGVQDGTGKTGSSEDGTADTAFACFSLIQAACIVFSCFASGDQEYCVMAGCKQSFQACKLTPCLRVSESHGWGTDDDSSVGQDSGAQTSEDNKEALKTLEREVGS